MREHLYEDLQQQKTLIDALTNVSDIELILVQKYNLWFFYSVTNLGEDLGPPPPPPLKMLKV